MSEGKARCKAWLQRRAGLPERPDIPMFAQIGRLDPQKGWDLLAEVAELLLERDVQLVVLGDGHSKYRAPCFPSSSTGMPAKSGRTLGLPTSWPTRSKPGPTFS